MIQWESPDADVRQDLHFLGVEVADPAAYAGQFGASLLAAQQLPAEAGKFQTPANERLAVESNPNETPIYCLFIPIFHIDNWVFGKHAFGLCLNPNATKE